MIRLTSPLDDVKKLYKDFRVSTCNCVDISLLARSVDNNQWKGNYSNPLGLARLVEAYEDCQLPKGKMSRTNWESKLTSAQQECLLYCLHFSSGYRRLYRCWQ